VLTIHQWESVNALQWFCERLDFKHVVDKTKLIIETVNSHRILFCRYAMCCLLTRGNLFSCVVNVCCSVAIFAAVCNDFSQVVFSHL